MYWDTRYRHFSGSTSEPILYRVIFIGIEVGLARGESNMTYGSKAVANLLIDVAKGHGQKLDQMKLQKLVYISHGWNLAISGNPLISDQIQAWQYGPVIPVLYNEFKNCGSNPITDYATEVNVDDSTLSISYEPMFVDQDDSHTRNLISKIWEVYGKFTGPQLSNLTHMSGTPWDDKFKNCPRSEIENDQIKEHFFQLAKQRNAQ